MIKNLIIKTCHFLVLLPGLLNYDDSYEMMMDRNEIFTSKLMVFYKVGVIMNWVFCIKYLDKSSHDVS